MKARGSADRRLLVAGVATIVLGLAAAGVVLFVPLASSAGARCEFVGADAPTCVSDSPSAVRVSLELPATLFLLCMMALAVVLGFVAVAGARRGHVAEGTLIGGTILWWAGTVVSLASVGLLFVPAGIAASVAAVQGHSVAKRER